MKLGTILLFGALMTVNSAQPYEELQRQYLEVTNKVGVLTEKLDTVMHSLKRYEKIDRVLHDLCAQLSGGDTDDVKSAHDTDNENPDSVLAKNQLSGGDTDDVKSDTHHEKTDSVLGNTQLSEGDNAGRNKSSSSFRLEEDLQVTFIKAERDQDGLFYSIQYSAPSEVVVEADAGFGGVLDNVENRFASGHGSIYVHSGETLVLTLFLPNRERMRTRIFTKVRSVTESRQVDVPSLTLSALPSEEAVFEKGASVNVTVRYRYETGGDEAPRISGLYTFYTVNNTASNTITGYVAGMKPTSVIVAERVDNSNRSDTIITINSDNNNCEGILLLQLQLQETSTSSFELYVIKNLEIPVRMADHAMPFPNGFLGFYTEGFANAFRSDGLACLEHGNCTGSVVLVGNDPENVTIWRKEDGQKTTANNVVVMIQKAMYTVRVVFRLVRASLADRGMYVLQGTSRSGTIIEKDLLIEVRVRFFVLKKHSGVMTSTEETLVVGCTVQGYPPPEIGFYDRPLGDNKRQRFVEGLGVSIEGHKSIDTSFSKLTIHGPHKEVRNIYCRPETDVLSEEFLVYDASVEHRDKL
ncbi:uncharacterized protein [Haliotis asinina]|uniref:uncharacterized protein n=1 Tax=Haliotis asinina TaxID=109174 RepID=UPI003532535C